jgi:Domain of unknown function (DUF4175)
MRFLVLIAAFGLALPAWAAASDEILVTAPKRSAPLRIVLQQEPRPTFFGSEQIRFAYATSGGTAPVRLQLRLVNRWQRRELDMGEIAPDRDDVLLAELVSNRWAGEVVQASLVAIDASGRRTVSRSYALALPRKTFLNPLAQRLSEFRQGLIDETTEIETTLDQLDGLRLSASFNNADPLVISKLRLAQLYLSERRSRNAGIDLLWITALDLEAATRVSIAELGARFDASLKALRYAPVPMNAPAIDP